MDYELAKKLKDAGFPFAPNDCDFCNNGRIRVEARTAQEYPVYAPTLSELISACGDRIRRIEKKRTLWHATEDDECCDEPEDQFGYCTTSGKTPEIAVAKLYLALYR